MVGASYSLSAAVSIKQPVHQVLLYTRTSLRAKSGTPHETLIQLPQNWIGPLSTPGPLIDFKQNTPAWDSGTTAAVGWRNDVHARDWA